MMLHHMARVCLRCYATWPGCVSEVTILRHMAWGCQQSYDVMAHGQGVSAKSRCYGTWPGCVSEVTMLWHMARVCQRSHDVMAHGQGVSTKLWHMATVPYGTWPFIFLIAKL